MHARTHVRTIIIFLKLTWSIDAQAFRAFTEKKMFLILINIFTKIRFT